MSEPGDLVSLSPEREAAGTRPWLSSEISEEENHHHMGADVRVSLTKTGKNTELEQIMSDCSTEDSCY